MVKAGVLGPLIILQVPVPVTGTLAVMLVVTTLQSDWFEPAIAEVGGAELVTVTVLDDAAQVPFTMLHWNT